MSIYTRIDDGYDVKVYRSAADLIKFILNSGYIATTYTLDSSDEDVQPSKASDVRKILKECGNVGSFYVYDAPYEGDDWLYKVQVHR